MFSVMSLPSKGFALGLVLTGVAFGSWLFLALDSAYTWDLPEHFPRPNVPDDNPMSAAKVELGRYLFYDTRLSVDGSTACATCHQQDLAFTDGRALSVGATGDLTPRSAMSLINVAYNARQTWANTILVKLEDQALVPLFNEEPVEMGLSGREDVVLKMLAVDARYPGLFAKAFGGDADPISISNITKAIAAFERSIISGRSPYDRYIAGDASALSESEVRGMDLFFSEQLECFHCHGGFNFTDSSVHGTDDIFTLAFHNTGLYNVDGTGGYPPDNQGIYEFTGNPLDIGFFKAPTLRNIAVTAPYMHDGSIETLEEVLDHYAAGGRVPNPNTSEFVPGFVLTDDERTDVLAFLESLTDEAALTDPRWSDPFK